MKKAVAICSIIIVTACSLAACSSWREITVRITEDELQERIAEKFPIVKSHQIFGTITYENPHISLQRSDNLVELGPRGTGKSHLLSD